MRKSKQEDPYAAALGMLARRPYSVAEMRRALERKFPGPDAARRDQAIARLRAQGYLDDRKFAEAWASSLARNRRFGRHRIRRELKAKLVDYRAIEPALDRAFEETDERALLEHVLDRKLRTLKLPLSQQKLASLCKSLLHRGFRADDIIKAVRSRTATRHVGDDLNLCDLEETTE